LTNVLYEAFAFSYFSGLSLAIERGEFPLLHTLELEGPDVMEEAKNMASLMKAFENNPGASASLTTLNLSGKEKDDGVEREIEAGLEAVLAALERSVFPNLQKLALRGYTQVTALRERLKTCLGEERWKKMVIET
jgi:hypothetical protein